MRTTAILAAICLSAMGCRQDPHVAAAIDSLNAQRRQLEDVVYEQEYEYEELLRKVEQLEEENQRLRRGDRDDDSSAPPRFDLSPRPPRDDADADAELAPPTIEFGAPADPQSAAPAAEPSRRLSPDADQSPLEASESSASQNAAGPEEINAPVTQLHLNPLHTSGADFDHRPGDDGLTVVVEPRSASGAFVPQPGPLSIVLLDPSLEGEAARVARWEIDVEQARQAMHRSEAARGIRLELPWPDRPPANSQLKLFVRMETAAGEKFEAGRDVLVTLPGAFSQRWTPRPIDRSRPEGYDAGQIAATPGENSQPREADAAAAEQRVSDARGSAAASNSTGRTSQQTPGALKKPQWSPVR